MTFSVKSSLILREIKTVFPYEGHICPNAIILTKVHNTACEVFLFFLPDYINYVFT